MGKVKTKFTTVRGGAKIVKEMGLAQVAGLAITEKNQLFSYQRDGQAFATIGETGRTKVFL